MKQKELYKMAVEKWGGDFQIMMVIEEMAELTQILTRINRNRPDEYKLPEEIADVEIMLAQLRVVYPSIEKEVQKWKRIKKRRLLKRLVPFPG